MLEAVSFPRLKSSSGDAPVGALVDRETLVSAAYVIKAEDLTALNFLQAEDPRPRDVEWIDRATDKVMKPSSVEMLLRTLHLEVASESVVRLHRSAGLRAIFRSDAERDRFALAFASAKSQRQIWAQQTITAIFDDRGPAMRALAELKAAGIPESAIALLSQASQFLETDYKSPEGHSWGTVAGTIAGGGIFGAVLGITVLAIPGLGAIGIAGALATSSGSAFAIFSSIAGATGAAIAKMLTDHDVDGVTTSHFAQQFRKGKIFISVEVKEARERRKTASAIFRQHRGRILHNH